jgi:hypothetical protein
MVPSTLRDSFNFTSWLTSVDEKPMALKSLDMFALDADGICVAQRKGFLRSDLSHWSSSLSMAS